MMCDSATVSETSLDKWSIWRSFEPSHCSCHQTHRRYILGRTTQSLLPKLPKLSRHWSLGGGGRSWSLGGGCISWWNPNWDTESLSREVLWLNRVCRMVKWSARVPKDWQTGVNIPIQKIGGRREAQVSVLCKQRQCTAAGGEVSSALWWCSRVTGGERSKIDEANVVLPELPRRALATLKKQPRWRNRWLDLRPCLVPPWCGVSRTTCDCGRPWGISSPPRAAAPHDPTEKKSGGDDQ